MNMFSLLFTVNICCTKNRFKIAIYKLNGLHISDEFAIKLCIGLFIMNLIGTDIILRGQLIPFLLYIFFNSYLSSSTIALLGNAANIYLLISIYDEIKCLNKTINCKCLEHLQTGSHTAIGSQTAD